MALDTLATWTRRYVAAGLLRQSSGGDPPSKPGRNLQAAMMRPPERPCEAIPRAGRCSASRPIANRVRRILAGLTGGARIRESSRGFARRRARSPPRPAETPTVAKVVFRRGLGLSFAIRGIKPPDSLGFFTSTAGPRGLGGGSAGLAAPQTFAFRLENENFV